MKTYTFVVQIREASDDFWDGLKGQSGCEQVTQVIKEALAMRGFPESDDCDIELLQFTTKGGVDNV
jgi:hypothetical protein